jgi:multimeric flavodoxin WrbA
MEKSRKIIAVNGSPRKQWNTHILLEQCLEGAKTAGAETELINLYDLQFKGCSSCFACKRKGNEVTKCVMKDDLEAVLQRICECDALILGSPIYFSSLSGVMKSFMERLLFPYTSYEGKPSSFGNKIRTAIIYTMNAPAFALPLIGYPKLFRYNRKIMKRTFGHSEYLTSTATYQFDDYSKYAMTYFDGKKRLKRRETIFIEDCKKAFNLGKTLCANSQKH